ncbi:hypothetical protein DWU95_36130, partial [Burkholderia contaminans]
AGDDLHAPHTGRQMDRVGRVNEACGMIPAELLWVSPGWGRKTCKGAEVRPGLTNMGADAKTVRNPGE